MPLRTLRQGDAWSIGESRQPGPHARKAATISFRIARTFHRKSTDATPHASALFPLPRGHAPSGTLAATRVPGTAPASSEPGLYEGPVWIGDALYFSDFTFGPGFPSRIQRLGPDGKLTTAILDSGSNGLALDARGDIVAATHNNKGIVPFELASGKRSLLAGTFQGQVFNSPNDLAIGADGAIYVTDPVFQRATGCM